MLIDVENEATWPSNVLKEFEKNYLILKDYAIWRISAYVTPVELSYSQRNHNPYESARDGILRKINSLIQDSLIVGYHCTRLLAHEIDDINSNGLALPSLGFLEKRLESAVIHGYFNEEEKYVLLNKNAYLEQPERENKLFFCGGRSTLREEYAIKDFFRCWGGESVLFSNENNTALFKIGIPCIVKAKLEQSKFIDLAEKMESNFLSNREKEIVSNSAFDYWVYKPIPKEKIIRILDVDSQEFENLTNHKQWKNAI